MSISKNLWLGQSIFLASIAALAAWGMSQTGWHFNYALDDAYIHLAIAKNVAFHQTWGMRPGEFCSASSSILWTVVLSSLMKIFGSSAWIPLIVNVLCGLALVRLYVNVAGNLPKNWQRTGWLLAMLFISPLAHLVLMGMEHMLQTLLFFTFFGVSCGLIRIHRLSDITWFLAVVLLVCAVRYEGLFLAAALCAWLIWKGDDDVHFDLKPARWSARESLPAVAAIAVPALLPVTIFGLWSHLQGGFFLPNSLMVKTDAALLGSPILFLKGLFSKVANLSPLLWAIILFNAAVCAFFKPEEDIDKRLWKGSFLLFLTALMHALFAKTGHLFRFEAALVTLAMAHGLLFLFQLLGKTEEKMARANLFFFLLIISTPFLVRVRYAIRGTELGMKNIREHHFEMLHFFEKNYPDQPFAINDIGVIGFYSDLNFIDLAGLGTTDILRTEARSDPAAMEKYCREKGVAVAALYPDWFARTIPTSWEKVGTWLYPDAVSCGDELVFFSTKPEETGQLRAALEAFSFSHPKIRLRLEPVK